MTKPRRTLESRGNSTYYTTINGGYLPEVVVTPTNDQDWLFQKGKYKRNIRPFIDDETRQYVVDYLSKFDNENAPEYNARIKRLADALEMQTIGIKKLDRDNHRAYYTTKDATMHVESMDNIFAELAHPWQDVFGNNDLVKENTKDYNADKDPRGGTRYAYPDTGEGETHAFFEPTLREYIETGTIGRSSPIIDKKKSKLKITPKDIREVVDSAASWDRQAINKRQIVNYSQLPLMKRVKYALVDFPLLNKDKKRYGGSIHIKPSKRGTFTAAATKHGMGVQEFAARVLRNKENYSPSLVKKANFARNASKWH